MKSTINQRLGVFIETLNISKTEFAVGIGRYKQQLDNWIHGGVKITSTALSEILKMYPQLNARWLMTGEGEMFYSDQIRIENEKGEDISREGYICAECEKKQKRIEYYQNEFIRINEKYLDVILDDNREK